MSEKTPSTPTPTPTPTRNHTQDRKIEKERLLLAETTFTASMKQRRINRERLCRMQQQILASAILFVVAFLMLNVLVKMRETRRGAEI
jgi:hypothetical protein